MVLSKDWLWDKKVSIGAAKTILGNPRDKHFLSFAGSLLSRKNIPKEVFKYYLKRRDFVLNWNRIKRQMRKNSWNDPRIEYWQAIYEKLREKDEFKNVRLFREEKAERRETAVFEEVANRIKIIRKQKGISQKVLAGKLKVSQQVISRVESGRENVSLSTLKKVADGLGAKLSVDIS